LENRGDNNEATILPEDKNKKDENKQADNVLVKNQEKTNTITNVHHKKDSKKTRNVEDPESKSEPPIDELGTKASYVAFRSCSANTYGVNPSKLYNPQIKHKPQLYTHLPIHNKPYHWKSNKRSEKHNYKGHKTNNMYGEKSMAPPKPRRYYEDDPEEHYMSDSDDAYMSRKEEEEHKVKQLAMQMGINPNKLFWFKKPRKCYWRDKVSKYSDKLDKVLKQSNNHIKELGDQWDVMNDLIGEMKTEIGIIDNSQDLDEMYYEDLWRENAKLMKDINKLKKEMKAVNQY